ncbi:hypothetical protein HDU91_003124, partial [Kappamyces sp. JEL0680]
VLAWQEEYSRPRSAGPVSGSFFSSYPSTSGHCLSAHPLQKPAHHPLSHSTLPSPSAGGAYPHIPPHFLYSPSSSLYPFSPSTGGAPGIERPTSRLEERGYNPLSRASPSLQIMTQDLEWQQEIAPASPDALIQMPSPVFERNVSLAQGASYHRHGSPPPLSLPPFGPPHSATKPAGDRTRPDVAAVQPVPPPFRRSPPLVLRDQSSGHTTRSGSQKVVPSGTTLRRSTRTRIPRFQPYS